MNDNECAVLEAALGEYFEGTLDSPTRSRVESHAAQCIPCRSLISDITGIRDEAASLAELGPSRDLWAGIESRIQPQVVSIATERTASRMSRKWLAAAAALLVASTSTITYFATSRSLGDGAAPATSATSSPVASSGGSDTQSERGSDSAPASAQAGVGLRTAQLAGAPVATRPPATLASSGNSAAALAITELPYDGEIRRLQTALVERRTQLDSATVRIVEENLRLIDTAVRQARAALAGDPASGFLSGRLSNALEKKVELLRTAAMLPSRT